MMILKEIILLAVKYASYAFLFRCIILFSYRIFLHPLHRYPGPFLAKLTDWYGAYHALLLRLHIVTHQDHQRYGDVIRHGPNTLVFNSIRALQDIYQNERLGKSTSYLVTQLGEPHIFNVFNVLDKKLHKHKRKIVGASVSQRHLQLFEPIMLQHIDTFLTQVLAKAENGEFLNMTEMLKRFGYDVVADLGFGESLKLQTEDKNRFMIRWLEVGNWRNNVHIQAPTVKYLGADVPLLLFLLLRGDKFVKMINGLVERRLERGKHSREDFFSLMIDSKHPETGKDISIDEVLAEALFFFPAGGDTTSTALCALLFYLSRYPDCHRRVATEVRSTFKSASEIHSGPKLAGCSYLRACFDETLRISPPVPGTLWRALSQGSNDEEPIVIDGQAIPPGTVVGVNIYSIHHNAKYFSEPFTFNPERWLERGSSSQDEGRNSQDAFTPFSSGSRGCAGKAMAYMEASLLIAKLLWYFDMERPDGPLDKVGGGTQEAAPGRTRANEFQLYDHFSTSHDGPYLVLKPRGQVCEDLRS